jgi:hypothetical protein
VIPHQQADSLSWKREKNNNKRSAKEVKFLWIGE